MLPSFWCSNCGCTQTSGMRCAKCGMHVDESRKDPRGIGPEVLAENHNLREHLRKIHRYVNGDTRDGIAGRKAKINAMLEQALLGVKQ